jgi:hypothetical protein
MCYQSSASRRTTPTITSSRRTACRRILTSTSSAAAGRREQMEHDMSGGDTRMKASLIQEPKKKTPDTEQVQIKVLSTVETYEIVG